MGGPTETQILLKSETLRQTARTVSIHIEILLLPMIVLDSQTSFLAARLKTLFSLSPKDRQKCDFAMQSILDVNPTSLIVKIFANGT